MFRLAVFKLLLGLLVALVVLAPTAMDAAPPSSEKGPRCSDGIDNDGDGFIDGDDPDCGGDGGDGGSPTDPTPSEISFRDAVPGDELLSDILAAHPTPDYVDGTPANLEVFLGSQGSIFLRNIDENDPTARQIQITVPAGSDPSCNLPVGLNAFDFKFLIADVESSLNGGVFSMGDGPGNSVVAPMKARFFHNGDAYQLLFNPDEKGPCKNGSGEVRVEKNGSTWTVTDDGSVCVEKAKNGPQKAVKCFMGEMNFSFDVTPLP